MVSWRLERVAALLAGFKLLLQLAAIAPYGYCRDELYYLACSEHLALGYVDHPPLSIVVLRIWRAAFGNSVTSIRVVPALAGASLVYITVRTARALGARTPAAALAGLGVVTAPAFFGFDHYFSMNALDHVVWAVAVRLVLDLDGSDRYRRIFLLLGAVLGLGALNKWSVGWLAPGLVLGVLVTPARGALLTRWPWLALVVFCALVLPHCLWEASAGWPTLEFMRHAQDEKYLRLSLPAFASTFAAMIGFASVRT